VEKAAFFFVVFPEAIILMGRLDKKEMGAILAEKQQ
jgi:hypothetical protein